MSKDTVPDEVFELNDSEQVLNLEFYLHRSILKWQDALEAALRQGEKIDAGLVNRALAGDMIEGVAKAKKIVHWEEVPIPKNSKGKQKENILRFNEEARDFQKRLNEFEAEVKKLSIPDNIKSVKISDFKVFEVLKALSDKSTKKGTVIV